MKNDDVLFVFNIVNIYWDIYVYEYSEESRHNPKFIVKLLIVKISIRVSRVMKIRYDRVTVWISYEYMIVRGHICAQYCKDRMVLCHVLMKI